MRSMKGLLIISLATLGLAAGCTSKAKDAQLATDIKAAMFSDPQTKDAGVQVDVKNGVATLTGTAPSDAAHLEAYKIATNTPGITKVDDQITVAKPDQTAQAAPTPEEQPATPEPPAKPERRSTRTTRHEPAPRASSATATHVPATPAPSGAAAVESSAAPQPQPVSVEIPAGTTVEVQTIDPIDSATAQEGQEYQASLSQPLTANGRVIVPAGSNVYIQVSGATQAGHYKGTNSLQLVLSRLEFKGKDVALATDPYSLSGGSRGKNTAEKVGGGAALGAIIGAIAGGGKGAAIGAGVGAAGGGVYQGATKAKAVKVAPETKLDFRLSQPLDLSFMP